MGTGPIFAYNKAKQKFGTVPFFRKNGYSHKFYFVKLRQSPFFCPHFSMST